MLPLRCLPTLLGLCALLSLDRAADIAASSGIPRNNDAVAR